MQIYWWKVGSNTCVQVYKSSITIQLYFTGGFYITRSILVPKSSALRQNEKNSDILFIRSSRLASEVSSRRNVVIKIHKLNSSNLAKSKYDNSIRLVGRKRVCVHSSSTGEEGHNDQHTDWAIDQKDSQVSAPGRITPCARVQLLLAVLRKLIGRKVRVLS